MTVGTVLGVGAAAADAASMQTATARAPTIVRTATGYGGHLRGSKEKRRVGGAFVHPTDRPVTPEGASELLGWAST